MSYMEQITSMFFLFIINSIILIFSCWLSSQKGLLWAFLGPAIIVSVVRMIQNQSFAFFEKYFILDQYNIPNNYSDTVSQSYMEKARQ